MTITLGDISIRYVHLLLNTAEDNGISTSAIAEQFLLTPVKLQTPYSRISIPRFMRLGERLMSQAEQPDLGLKCGQSIRLSELGLTGYLAANANSLTQALIDIAYYEKLSSQNLRGHSSVSISDSQVKFLFYSISPYNNFNYFIVDLALRGTINFINELNQQAIAPERVNFEFPAPSYVALYVSYFQVPVYFNQSENSVIYRKKDLNPAPRQANPITYLEVKAECDKRFNELNPNDSFVEQVMNEIGPLLTAQKPSMEQVAHNIGMPPWTLRRRLKEEQVRFKDLIDETRKSLASIYTKDPQYSLEEISFLVGFSNPTAFHRAFKRWFGCTATQYRQQLNRQD